MRTHGDGLSFELVIDGWEEFIRTLLDGIERDQPTAIRKVAIDFLGSVIPKTPVDTGRARGGWQAYLIAQGVPVRVTSQKPGGGRAGAFSEAAVAQGIAEGSYEEEFSRTDAFVALINAVEYIVYLEYGSSDQAPAGMVRITFREFEAGENLTDALVEMLQDNMAKANEEARRAARTALSRPSRLPML